jgi:transcriptional regulator of acetoin/glycerol metabolism
VGLSRAVCQWRAHLSDQNDSITLPHYAARGAASTIERPVVLIVGSNVGCDACWPGRVQSFKDKLALGRRTAERSPENSLVLRDPTMSSRHMIISSIPGGEFELRDLGSTNGTFVNGDLVHTSVKLQDGAVICAGAHAMVFRKASPGQLEAISQELAAPLGPQPTVNPSFALMCQRMRLLATSNEDVLLSGERGVGKEIYARAIHRASSRKGEFVTFDCAAVPPESVETELFGGSGGAFSRGLVEQAEGGTLFLDDVEELVPSVLAKLLRFTEGNRMGSTWAAPSRRIDVRVIAATSRTGLGKSSTGVRADLVDRFGFDAISVPPLRDRVEDIGAVAHTLLASPQKPFDLEVFQALCLHRWPGNVRELRKTLASAEALAQGSNRIGLDHLPSALSGTLQRCAATRRRRPRPPPTVEELKALFQRCRGNVLQVARELDRKPAVVYRWARRFGLQVKGFRSLST